MQPSLDRWSVRPTGRNSNPSSAAGYAAHRCACGAAVSRQIPRVGSNVQASAAFFKVDVAAKAVTASAGRKSTLITAMHINGRLVVQGGENGRGWSATIDEDNGVMSAAVVDEDHTFSLFGACTTP
jgi:hypothetical protein